MQDEGCVLRPVEERDLARLLVWRNSDRIRAVMFNDELITPEEHRAWFEKLQQGGDIHCLIFEQDGRPVGVVNVNQIDRRNGICHWGFYLGETDVPRGTGAAMGRLAFRQIFEVLGIRKLIGETFAFNVRSIDFHKRLGFSEEGCFRRQVLKGGRYEDVLSLALFREEWLDRGDVEEGA
jgi:UDP-4-amino-4,6-dideoxy-N-acetyl-beta-L-altrosamine N-acetyltransferase